jgi:hypothetical protein
MQVRRSPKKSTMLSVRFIISTISLFVGFITVLGVAQITTSSPKLQNNPLIIGALIVGAILTIVSLISISLDLFPSLTSSLELEPLREERLEINRRLKEKPKEDVVDTIRLGLNQLTEYYVINKDAIPRVV